MNHVGSMHQSSFQNMKKFKETYLDASKELRILEVGSYDVNGTYRELFNEPKWIFHGADMIPGNNVDIVLKNPYNWHNIPSNSYDVIISGQAFEHIEFFWATSLQINRVLKNSGLCCIIAPSAGPEHRYPVDCWRFYPDGMKTIAKWSRMEILDANTDWNNPNYTDDSNNWKDSVLICIKVVDSPDIKSIIKTMDTWINEKKDTQVEQLQEEMQKIDDIQIDKRNYIDILKHKILSTQRIYPKWYESIAYLLLVYMERKDLQEIFPTVMDKGDLTDLFCWAVNHGIKEDSRLSRYTEYYTRFCGLNNDFNGEQKIPYRKGRD